MLPTPLSHVLLDMLLTTDFTASVRLRLRLTPLFSMVLTMVSHSAPALVLTQSPRDLMRPPRDMLLMLILDMVMATLDTTASVMLMLRLTPLFCMLDTHMPLSMVLSPMLLLPPLPDSSTLPTLVSALTTLELLFLAKQFHPY